MTPDLSVVALDELIRKITELPRAECARCEGTGNELFSMYRRCEACQGRGFNRIGWYA